MCLKNFDPLRICKITYLIGSRHNAIHAYRFGRRHRKYMPPQSMLQMMMKRRGTPALSGRDACLSKNWAAGVAALANCAALFAISYAVAPQRYRNLYKGGRWSRRFVTIDIPDRKSPCLFSNSSGFTLCNGSVRPAAFRRECLSTLVKACLALMAVDRNRC